MFHRWIQRANRKPVVQRSWGKIWKKFWRQPVSCFWKSWQHPLPLGLEHQPAVHWQKDSRQDQSNMSTQTHVCVCKQAQLSSNTSLLGWTQQVTWKQCFLSDFFFFLKYLRTPSRLKNREWQDIHDLREKGRALWLLLPDVSPSHGCKSTCCLEAGRMDGGQSMEKRGSKAVASFSSSSSLSSSFYEI